MKKISSVALTFLLVILSLTIFFTDIEQRYKALYNLGLYKGTINDYKVILDDTWYLCGSSEEGEMKFFFKSNSRNIIKFCSSDGESKISIFEPNNINDGLGLGREKILIGEDEFLKLNEKNNLVYLRHLKSGLFVKIISKKRGLEMIRFEHAEKRVGS